MFGTFGADSLEVVGRLTSWDLTLYVWEDQVI